MRCKLPHIKSIACVAVLLLSASVGSAAPILFPTGAPAVIAYLVVHANDPSTDDDDVASFHVAGQSAGEVFDSETGGLLGTLLVTAPDPSPSNRVVLSTRDGSQSVNLRLAFPGDLSGLPNWTIPAVAEASGPLSDPILRVFTGIVGLQFTLLCETLEECISSPAEGVLVVPFGLSAIVRPDQDPSSLTLSSQVIGSTVTLSWTPAGEGGTPAAYQLEAGSVPGDANVAVLVVPGTQTSMTVPNVPAGTYYVRVRSLVGGVASGVSNEIAVVVGGSGCAQAPSPPTQLGSQVAGRLVTLSWSVPAGAAAPTGFQIEAGSVSGAANLGTLTVDGALRSFAVQAPPGTYFVRVRSLNACGVSGPSNEIVVNVF